VIKRQIDSSSGDLYTTWRAIHNAIRQQHNQIDLIIEQDKINRLNLPKNWLYVYLNKRISRYSLRLIDKQRFYADQATPQTPVSACTNYFTSIMGLPCKHRLASLIKSEQPIPLAEIHPFWRIGLDSADEAYLPPLLNPRPATTQRSNQTTDNGGVAGPLKK
jgi:hypothetical protein